jgi:hypothetical protein
MENQDDSGKKDGKKDVVSDGDRTIEVNVKELFWDYGEAGYPIGLEIEKWFVL